MHSSQGDFVRIETPSNDSSLTKALVVVNYGVLLAAIASVAEGLASQVPLTPTRAAWVVHLPAEAAKRIARSLGMLY